jgi:uncharacterized protein (UPF0332 family)
MARRVSQVPPGSAQLETMLSRVTSAEKHMLDLFTEGASIERRSTRSIVDLRHQASVDRIALSKAFEHTANKLMKARPRQYRSAISRYYYSMYHAARAVVFFTYGGDDHEAHSVLPRHLPRDFPNQVLWQNELKNARLNRNGADYDPYPSNSAHWRGLATSLSSTAPIFHSLAKNYLKTKGCSYI